jgi:hypothetical protein
MLTQLWIMSRATQKYIIQQLDHDSRKYKSSFKYIKFINHGIGINLQHNSKKS